VTADTTRARFFLGSARALVRHRTASPWRTSTVRRLAGWNERLAIFQTRRVNSYRQDGLRRGRRKQHARRVRSPELLRPFVFGFFLFASLHAFAAEVIPPKPTGYFNDYAGVVSRETAYRFNEQLAQFERETSDQVVVAVFPKMQSDSDIADYTQRVAQAWGVGQKDRRNGVVLLVFVQDRKMSIQVGYGLEGALPDITAYDIRANHIQPYFRVGDYEGGLATGIDLICKAILGEYKGSGKTVAAHRGNPKASGLLFFVIFVIVLIVLSRVTRGRGGYGYSSRRGGPIFFPMGGGGSSSGGGGFSGFSGGGGSFGGGGSSGSW
jgi:uncharacterized protein